MAKSLLKIFFFSLPVILVLLLPAVIIFFCREYYSVDDILYAQRKDPSVLYNTCCSNLRAPYKKALVLEKNPEIITLGTSRVLEFRQEFFRDPAIFANAGQAIVNINDLPEFMRKLKVILLGLDHQMFTPGYATQDTTSFMPESVVERFGTVLGGNWKRIYTYMFQGKVPADIIVRSFRSDNVGMAALTNGSGFRADGSYNYGDSLEERDQHFSSSTDLSNMLASLSSDREAFLYGTRISGEAVNNLKQFLDMAKKRNIVVIGFLPPYPQGIYRKMLSVPDAYAKMVTQLPATLTNIFAAYGDQFYDYSDDSVIGAGQNEYVDPFHGTDKLSLRVLIDIAKKQKKQIGQYVDIIGLEKLLVANSKNHLTDL